MVALLQLFEQISDCGQREMRGGSGTPGDMLLRPLDLHILGIVIRLDCARHLRIGDLYASALDDFFCARRAGDCHQCSPARMYPDSYCRALHCNLTITTKDA